MKYSIGKTQKEDIPAIADLEQHCFSMPLTEKQIRSLIEAGNTCFLTAKMSDSGGCESEVLGYIGMQTVLDEGYILNIAVSESYRQQGIADALMESIEEESVRRSLAFISLEVRESNLAAVSLYRKHGYLLAGRRVNYYSRPREDALIYTKFFSEKQIKEDSI